jgi:hypothetical protein
MTTDFKVTHETDWRRVRWVHDPEYQGLVAGIDEDDEKTRKVAQRELEDLRAGNLVCLGAIVETMCSHCKQWTHVDSLWNIIVQPDDDLEALGSEILEIPEKPVDPTTPEGGCSSAPWKSPTLDEPEPKSADQLRLDSLLRSDFKPGPADREEIKDLRRKLKAEPKRKPRGPGLARIVLQFDPDTLSAMRQAVYVRRLTGQSGGLLDAFTGRLLQKIEAGEATWEVKQKKAVD